LGSRRRFCRVAVLHSTSLADIAGRSRRVVERGKLGGKLVRRDISRCWLNCCGPKCCCRVSDRIRLAVVWTCVIRIRGVRCGGRVPIRWGSGA
jgi:hypothetical protein